MPKAIGTDTYGQAQNKPVTKAADLKKWWKRRTPTFLPFKVEVKRWEPRGKFKDLVFELTGDDVPPGVSRGPYTVEMTRADDLVWSDLPSTAQLAKQGEHGFLFLSHQWAELHSISTADFETAAEGGKWPIVAGETRPQRLAKFLLDLLEDKDLDKKLGKDIKNTLRTAAQDILKSNR